MNRFAIAKIAFCKPAGMLRDRTCLALCGSIRSIDRSSRTTLPERRRDKITSAAEIYWEMMLASATPAAANADALVYDVMAAIYTACSSFMSQNYGAGKRKRILHSYFISMAFSFGIALVMSALLVIFGRQFLGIFTNVEEVAQAGMIRLRIMGCSYAFSAFMDCTIAANRGLGKSFVPTVIVIMGSCVFRIIWVYTVFAYFHTIESLYLLYIVSWAITATAEMICLRRVYREQMQKLPPDIDSVKATA